MGIINDGRHVKSIMATTPCGRHSAELGEPCFWSHGSTPGYKVLALCNKRIKKAGFNGKISVSSYQQKAAESSRGRKR